MRSKTIIMILSIAFVLVSCQGQAITTPQGSLPETSTPIPGSFTETAKTTITATSLLMPVPPTETRLPTLKPTELPLDVNVFIRQSMISPSGRWLALVMMTRVENSIGNKDSFILTVVNQHNSVERIVEKIDAERLMGHSIPWALAWSEKEDYLFYTHRFGGSDGCFNDDDFFGTDLFKVNLESGESLQLSPNLGYWLALSPDQTFVASITRDDTLKIRNIETGEEKETSINGRGSHLIWSPNGKELLLTLEDNLCTTEDHVRNSIIKVNATTLSQTILVKDDPNRPITLEWVNDDTVLVEDENNLYWFLNPFNGQMTERK